MEGTKASSTELLWAHDLDWALPCSPTLQTRVWWVQSLNCWLQRSFPGTNNAPLLNSRHINFGKFAAEEIWQKTHECTRSFMAQPALEVTTKWDVEYITSKARTWGGQSNLKSILNVVPKIWFFTSCPEKSMIVLECSRKNQVWEHATQNLKQMLLWIRIFI